MADVTIRVNAEVAGALKAADALNAVKSGIKELDYLFRQNKISMAQFQIQMKGLADTAAGMNLTYKQQVDLNAQIFQATERATIGFKSLGRSVGELRGAIPAMTSLTQIIQDAPFGIKAVANNVTMLVQQFAYLKAEAGGSGAALKGLAQAAVGPGGLLMLVSIGTSLAVMFGDKLVAAFRSSTAEFKLLASEIRAIEGTISMFETLYGFRIKDIKKFSDKRITSEINVRTGFIGGLQSSISENQKALDIANAEGDEKRIKSLEKQIQLSEKRLAVEMRFLEALVEERKERPGRLSKEARDDFDITIDEAFADNGSDARYAGQMRAQSAREKNQKRRDDRANNKRASFSPFRDSFIAGIDQMAGVTTGKLGRAFADVFGGAQTLLGSFAEAFAQTMTDLAAKYAIGLLFNLIGGPFAGIGGSLLSGLGIGGKAAAGVAGAAGRMQSANYGRTPTVRIDNSAGSFRVRGRDLVYVTDSSRRAMAGVSY